jgi:hypothetical protein
MKVKNYLSIEYNEPYKELIDFLAAQGVFTAVDEDGFVKFIYLESLKSFIDDYLDYSDTYEEATGKAVLNAYKMLVTSAEDAECHLICFYSNGV